MKNPFKSKYYYAIIDKIAELENMKEDVKAYQDAHKIGDLNWDYYQTRSEKLQEEINLLRALL